MCRCGGQFRDITERKQVEAEREALLASEQKARQEAETANRTKDEFLATLSHELRTPLTAILGWARMISDNRLSEEDKAQGLEIIQRNALLQAQLVEDILDVSRIVSGKLRMEVRPVELSSVIEGAVESVLPAAEAKEIRLQRVLDSGTSLVSGDPNRLQQVVWNLLMNAIKFTPKGGRVQVRLERVNSHIEIIVADTASASTLRCCPTSLNDFARLISLPRALMAAWALGWPLCGTWWKVMAALLKPTVWARPGSNIHRETASDGDTLHGVKTENPGSASTRPLTAAAPRLNSSALLSFGVFTSWWWMTMRMHGTW
jgi:K+-sensing histidine kinase KdpD